MLVHLTIQNVVLIERLDLSLLKGYTALTGETGAGKSILLDALSLALGAKTDLSLVRQGSDTASVTAQFDLSDFEPHHYVFQLLREHDIELDEDKTLLLRRVLSQQKSRAFVNDMPVTVNLIKQLGDFILHIHGQHDSLLDEDIHQQVLDNYAAAQSDHFQDTVNNCTLAFEQHHTIQKQLAIFDKQTQEHALQAEYFAQVIKELGPLNLQKDTEETLLERRQALSQLGKVMHSVEAALKTFESPQSWVTGLFNHHKSLEKSNPGGIFALDNAIKGIESCAIDLQEAVHELKSLHDTNRSATQELQDIDDQLHMIRSVCKKYRVANCVELCTLLDEAEQNINNQDLRIAQRNDFQHKLNEALTYYQLCEQHLFKERADAAEKLTTLIQQELPELKLEAALFEIRISRQFDDKKHIQPRPNGGHKVVFWAAMNAGQNMTPLAKCASGGEMARLMLVLKMVIAKTTALPTLIFDEIDTGVGGAVAMAIGKKLRQLSHYVQVLSITHSAQVAAAAHHQWQISKRIEDNQTFTNVVTLSENEREIEIARMLSGEQITEEAKLAARSLRLNVS